MARLLGFGASRIEVWRKLSAQLGGTYTERTWRQSDRIDVMHEHWTVTLDTYSVHINNVHIPHTRFRAPFLNSDAFRCKIYRSSLFSALGSWLGTQDVEIGHEPFDREWVVKTNHEAKVRALCQNADLRRMLAEQKAITLSVEDHEGWFTSFPQGTDELRVVVLGHLTDIERMRALYDLFAVALDQLCAIGAAYEKSPDFKL